MNIVLTGFMASGKTNISKQLARLLRYKWIDTDEMIEREKNMSINDIFKNEGEDAFRKIEHSVICRISNLSDTVISTGGGVVLNPDNIKALRQGGVIVNLAPSFNVIEERLADARSTRPLLKDSDLESIRKRFNDRSPYYDNCDFKIKVSNDYPPKHYALEIAKMLKLI